MENARLPECLVLGRQWSLAGPMSVHLPRSSALRPRSELLIWATMWGGGHAGGVEWRGQHQDLNQICHFKGNFSSLGQDPVRADLTCCSQGCVGLTGGIWNNRGARGGLEETPDGFPDPRSDSGIPCLAMESWVAGMPPQTALGGARGTRLWMPTDHLG